jgi:hypothetical protein
MEQHLTAAKERLNVRFVFWENANNERREAALPAYPGEGSKHGTEDSEEDKGDLYCFDRA